jgi:glycosyltransferase involved in cell wall biosynthesis
VPAPPLPAPARTPEQVRAELGVPDGTALLLTVARFAPQKGLSVLIDAVQLLAAQGLAVQAVVAGEGPLEAALEAQAQARQAPVRLIGPRQDVADLLAAADLVVVPSLWEGQALIVHEAMVAGAAIVATNAGGTLEVTQDAAVLVPPSDAGALATAIGALLRDPAERDRLRALAVARAKSLPTQDDAVQQVADVYQEVVARSRSGHRS